MIELETVPNPRYEEFSYDTYLWRINEKLRVAESNITIENSTFENDFNFSNVLFNHTTSFYGTNFKGSVYFMWTSFNGPVDFGKVIFNSFNDFTGANFGSYAGFTNATFNNTANFRFANFGSYCGFAGAIFNNTADFRLANFGSYASFPWPIFNSTVNFASLDDAAELMKMNFDNYIDLYSFYNIADFDAATFNEAVDFIGANFSICAYFVGANFRNSVTFSEARFDDYADFSWANFGGYVDFSWTTFSNIIEFMGVTFDDTANFYSAVFDDTAEFEGPVSPTKIVSDGLNCQVFMKYYKDQGQYENADIIYYNYRKENQARKQWYEISKWLDIIAWITCGYGMKPSYSLYFGGTVVILFSIIYEMGPHISVSESGNNKIPIILSFRGPGIIMRSESLGNKPQKVSFWDALNFSITTFTTVGYGNWYPKESFKKWATLEGLFGWVMLGIFMSTLTRVIIRI